jgi:hypothetical protein
VTRQAIGKRVKELKAKNHELKLFIDNARRSEKEINFSEISPTQRRKAGIDETYGQGAYSK